MPVGYCVVLIGHLCAGYIVEKMDTETGKWTHCAKTDGDLECDVKGLQTGKRYRFRVRAKNDEGESEPLEGPDDATLIKVFSLFISSTLIQ